MTENQIKDIVKTEIKKYIDNDLDKDLSKYLKNKSKSRDEMISAIKDSFESVYKVLWQKRDFWKSDIK